MFSNFFFENRDFFLDNVNKNILERGRLQMTIWCMRIACWIKKKLHRHTHNT